ncbi:efflux RND transporter periplasmic adaptor subunit [Jhaorihella thermophila]|uniref:Membrane fusion protein, multidrug efflux system n=1 Tax=Jhaorihella thermophila TaxID=488547 RepID=A0A1H5WUM2_9RHOB|nr:efflux RND transporter periplasmic adaptor subunit [Jhaorihella thermophila]SEG03249.1 membrane fusion protein, multidrug efflux system [Jhaorihella thermophila]
MRVVPIITATVVTLALYLLIFERDTVLAFARGENVQTQTEPAPAPTNPAADMGAAADKAVMRVLARHSTARTVDSAVILRGQTRAIRQVQVRAETTGRVISEPLRKGASVEAGDVLCRLEPGTRPAALTEARARLEEAEAARPAAQARVREAASRLEEATINYNAAKQLIDDGYASQTRLAATRAAVDSARAALETAKAGLESAEAAVQAARAAVAAAEKEIERLTIKAPFAGLLDADTAELGELLQPGALCATVIQLNPIKFVGYVPETEVDRVKVGAQAGALLVNGRRVMGTVTYLSRVADPQTRTFAVEVEVPNEDLSIRDGQTAEVAIAAAGTKAHLLPQSALTLNSDGALGVRLVGPDDIVQFAAIEVIRDTPDGVWITGLPDRADVIVAGQDFVTAGVRVLPQWEEASR